MTELLVMRHAKSDWSGFQADIDRPLNKRGRNNADTMGARLLAMKLVPDRIVSSPSQRTRDTVKGLQHHLELDEDSIEYDPMLYLASKSLLLDCIRDNIKEGERLMILAHNPGIDDLVERLSDRALPLTDSMKLMTTAAVAHFSVELKDGRFDPSSARLIELLRPGDVVTEQV